MVKARTLPLSLSGPALAWQPMYMKFLAFVLVGLALGGRGFAYFGIPPLFISELTLLAGLVCIAFTTRAISVFKHPTSVLLIIMIGWCFSRTVPYLATYRLDAVRDAMLYMYSLMAFVVAGLLCARPQYLRLIVLNYRKFAVLFILSMPVLAIVQGWPNVIPVWPWSGTPIIQTKAGDTLSHLAGVASFVLVGLMPMNQILIAVVGSVIAVLSGNRAGQLALMIGMIASVLTGGVSAMRTAVVGVILVGMFLVGVSGVVIPIPGSDREIDFGRPITRLASIFEDEDNDSRGANTKSWRLEWWRAIYGYTVEGPYYWTGKGFGINLADDDGFLVSGDFAIRAPHNSHLSFLARAGVPGFVIYAIVQLSWLVGMIATIIRAKLSGYRTWAAVSSFIVAYWAAFMTNANFDIVLEGPMAGMWFWSIFGVGLAVMILQSRNPEVLADAAPARA